MKGRIVKLAVFRDYFSVWHFGHMYDAVLPVLIFSMGVLQVGHGFPVL